jgi:RNA polymerase sigma factor (sigma-70 family)
VTQPAATPAAPAPREPPDSGTLGLLRNGVYLLALHELREPGAAEDVAQESIARLLDAIARRGGSIENLATFTRGIARHIIADAREALKRAEPIERVANAVRHALVPDPLREAVTAEESRRLADAFTALPTSDQKLLRTLFVENLTPGDLAARLGEPPERLRKQKSRALARLRRAFLGHDSASPATDMQGSGHDED